MPLAKEMDLAISDWINQEFAALYLYDALSKDFLEKKSKSTTFAAFFEIIKERHQSHATQIRALIRRNRWIIRWQIEDPPSSSDLPKSAKTSMALPREKEDRLFRSMKNLQEMAIASGVETVARLLKDLVDEQRDMLLVVSMHEERLKLVTSEEEEEEYDDFMFHTMLPGWKLSGMWRDRKKPNPPAKIPRIREPPKTADSGYWEEDDE